MHAGFPFASPCVLGGCEPCSATKFSSLSLHMVPHHYYACARWWSVGMHPVLLIALHEFSYRTVFFLDLLALLLPRKIDFPCAYKAYYKKLNADILLICISLCSWWVCSSNLQPNFRVSFSAWSLSITMIVQAGSRVVYIPCAADWLAWIEDLFFWQFWALLLPRKLVFHAQTKPARRR